MRDHREAILDAISADYGNRSRHETLFAEIFGVMDGVDHTLKHLKLWMKPQKRGVDWRNFFGASNRVIPQPVGIVGHIVPWNFPIFLCFGGLTSAFAAGNRCMVKMSENSRHLARLLIDKAPAYFPREKLAFFDETGGVGMEFSKLKFDHILFTGSGQTGRAVMAAASQNLCPVTLELGGKAPALICDDFPLDKATERITFFKYFNAGQICTTADHVFVPQHKVDEFVEIARKAVVAHAIPAWRVRISPRSSTSAPSTASPAPWKRRRRAGPRWCNSSPARNGTRPRARSRRTSFSMRHPTANCAPARSSGRCCQSFPTPRSMRS